MRGATRPAEPTEGIRRGHRARNPGPILRTASLSDQRWPSNGVSSGNCCRAAAARRRPGPRPSWAVPVARSTSLVPSSCIPAACTLAAVLAADRLAGRLAGRMAARVTSDDGSVPSTRIRPRSMMLAATRPSVRTAPSEMFSRVRGGACATWSTSEITGCPARRGLRDDAVPTSPRPGATMKTSERPTAASPDTPGPGPRLHAGQAGRPARYSPPAGLRPDHPSGTPGPPRRRRRISRGQAATADVEDLGITPGV